MALAHCPASLCVGRDMNMELNLVVHIYAICKGDGQIKPDGQMNTITKVSRLSVAAAKHRARTRRYQRLNRLSEPAFIQLARVWISINAL